MELIAILLVILIAVIASPMAKDIVRKLVEFSIKSIPILGLIFLGTGLIYLFANWGWNKLHEINPDVTLKDILGYVLFFILFIAGIYGFDETKKKLGEKEFNKRVKKHLIIYVVSFVLGMGTVIFNNLDINFYYLIFLGYPVFLILRFFYLEFFKKNI